MHPWDQDRGSAWTMTEGLYRAHRQRLYAFFWSRTGSREDALDLVQEVFLRAWRHAELLAGMPEGRRQYWLFACARTLGIDHHRHRQVVSGAERMRPPETAAADRADAGLRLEAAETRQSLDRAIRQLPDPLRDVLALKVMGEMTSAEIGGALGIPAGTVRYRLMQARQALERALAGRGGQ